jgi:hypothetical protein
MFAQWSTINLMPFKTSIWNYVKSNGTLGGYATEADVNWFNQAVLVDVLNAIGLFDVFQLLKEVEVLSLRPDWMVLYLNGHPVGVIEGKQPGAEAMHHERILGEVFDQLMHVRTVFRVSTPFAILTSYAQWRVCWLDDATSVHIASQTEYPPLSPYTTPLKRSRGGTQNQDSRTAPPTPSAGLGPVALLQPDEDEQEDKSPSDVEDASTRMLCASKVYEASDPMLPLLLATVFQKMALTGTNKIQHVEGKEITAVLRLAHPKGFQWKRVTYPRGLQFGSFLSKAISNFFFWEELGSGAHGKTYLVSGGSGSVGVLKFFYGMERGGQAEEECKWWQLVYGRMPAVSNVRVVRVMGKSALLMPWFAPPSRNVETQRAIVATLENDYHKNFCVHEDVAWRNVGVYSSNGVLAAVVYDMGNVRKLKQGESDQWVEKAAEYLLRTRE